MNSCVLNFDDFKRVFDFSVNYHLTCASLADRTNGNPRNLGGIMDAFSRGKLIEIGVEKILHNADGKKKYILDFDMHSANNEPDIVKVYDKDNFRDVKNYIEIKSLSNKDEWIGPREEQFTSIKMYASHHGIMLKDIFLIYAELKTKEDDRRNDITGMFLKEIEDREKCQIFQKYANLNAEVNIEFIISFEELEKYGRIFRKDIECIYEANVFNEIKYSTIYKDGVLRNNFEYIDNNIENIKLHTNTGDALTQKDLTKIDIINKDSDLHFNIVKKTNRNSTRYFLETFSNISVFNSIFGNFELQKNKVYSLDINTKGRKPILKNNNLFISRKRVYELMRENKIHNVEARIQYIIDSI